MGFLVVVLDKLNLEIRKYKVYYNTIATYTGTSQLAGKTIVLLIKCMCLLTTLYSTIEKCLMTLFVLVFGEFPGIITFNKKVEITIDHLK